MERLSQKNFSFGRFVFDSEHLVLYHDGTLVKGVEKRSLQVLAILLSRSGEPVSHEEIIEKVWADNPYGVTSARVNQYVSRLRKVLAAFDREETYIETLIGRGYSFVHNVTTIPNPVGNETAAAGAAEDADNFPKTRKSYVWLYLALLVVALSAVTGGYWKYGVTDDVEEIKRVVKESQMFESLVIYRDPAEFDEDMLDRYWISESDGQANFDRSRIRQSVKKLVTEGRRYGEQTECMTFEFEKVEINAKRDVAIVRTFEKWTIEDNAIDGSASKKRTVGPYFVDYVVRKRNGRWLIEKSTTGRSVRPTPRLESIELTRDENEGWFANITGLDFEPSTIFFEVIGPECLALRPCRIENFQLRDESVISDTSILKVPLKNLPGDYQITARNGDSSPSNTLTFYIP